MAASPGAPANPAVSDSYRGLMDKVDHDDFLLVALTENEGCRFFFLDFGDDFLCRDCWRLSDERRVSVSRLVNSDEFDWLPVSLIPDRRVAVVK